MAERKGYTKNLNSRADTKASKPRITQVLGTVGAVKNLYQVWDRALKKRNWNWQRLGDELGVSRQHVVSLTDGETIKEDKLRAICAILDLDPDKLIQWRKHGKKSSKKARGQ